jgi:hypothetical protein
MGTDLTFVDITESSATDPGPLYGTPTVSGNSLDFTPPSFFAISSFQAPPLDRTDGLLTFMAVSKPGKTIENMFFQEGGARSIGGFGTDQTFIDVSAVGFLQVSEVDGLPISVQTFNLNFKFDFGSNGAQDNGTWRLISEGTDTDLWIGSQFVDIKQGLIDRGVPFVKGATKVTVIIDNILYAQSEPLASGFIDKKDFFTVTTNIPEPTSCVLAMFGLMVGALVSRRSR